MVTKPKPARPRRDRNRGLELMVARRRLNLEQAEVGAYWPVKAVSKQRISRIEAGATTEAATQYRQALAAAAKARAAAPTSP